MNLKPFCKEEDKGNKTIRKEDRRGLGGSIWRKKKRKSLVHLEGKCPVRKKEKKNS